MLFLSVVGHSNGLNTALIVMMSMPPMMTIIKNNIFLAFSILQANNQLLTFNIIPHLIIVRHVTNNTTPEHPLIHIIATTQKKRI